MDKVKAELLHENVIQKMEGLLDQERSEKEKEHSEKEQTQANEAKALEELEKAYCPYPSDYYH